MDNIEISSWIIATFEKEESIKILEGIVEGLELETNVLEDQEATQAQIQLGMRMSKVNMALAGDKSMDRCRFKRKMKHRMHGRDLNNLLMCMKIKTGIGIIGKDRKREVDCRLLQKLLIGTEVKIQIEMVGRFRNKFSKVTEIQLGVMADCKRLNSLNCRVVGKVLNKLSRDIGEQRKARVDGSHLTRSEDGKLPATFSKHAEIQVKVIVDCIHLKLSKLRIGTVAEMETAITGRLKTKLSRGTEHRMRITTCTGQDCLKRRLDGKVHDSLSMITETWVESLIDGKDQTKHFINPQTEA